MTARSRSDRTQVAAGEPLSAWGLVDSHAHIDLEYFGARRQDVIVRARAAGVSGIMLIASSKDPAIFGQTMELAASAPNLWMAGGIHPHCASFEHDLLPELRRVRSRLAALGEIGLDFHYDFSPREQQVSVFARQLELALEWNLPVVLHVREAWEEALPLLDGLAKSWRGVLHCFTRGPDIAREYLQRGLHVSIPGVLTFPNSAELRETARQVPLERLLLETDSPYLAPVPHRGRPNEPAYIAHTLAVLAEQVGSAPQDLARAVNQNFQRVFGVFVQPFQDSGDSEQIT